MYDTVTLIENFVELYSATSHATLAMVTLQKNLPKYRRMDGRCHPLPARTTTVEAVVPQRLLSASSAAHSAPCDCL
jgi:hypothetical protein